MSVSFDQNYLLLFLQLLYLIFSLLWIGKLRLLELFLKNSNSFLGQRMKASPMNKVHKIGEMF